MKKTFFLSVFLSVMLYSSEDVIGKIIFDTDYNYVKNIDNDHHPNEHKINKYSKANKTKVKNRNIRRKKQHKTNASDVIKKAKLLRKKGIYLLVWRDRIPQTRSLVNKILSLPKSKLDLLIGHTIVASKGKFSFLHKKTGFLFLSTRFTFSDLYRLVKRKSINKSVVSTNKNVFLGTKRMKKLSYDKKIEFYKRNAKKLENLFEFRGVYNENKLFLQLVQISEKELPILYHSIIIPTRNSRVYRDSRTGCIYIDTRATKKIILEDLR